jgi:hypothetical protein
LAEDEAALPWDDQTDQYIEAIDEANSAEKRSSVSLREMLMNPNDYIGKEGIEKDIEELQAISGDYFTQMLSGLQDEQKRLDQLLVDSDTFYSKVDGLIETKASSAGVPYIEPYYVSSNPDNREEIILEKYKADLDLLIGKLATVSNYIANLSSSYKEHRFGSWIFSGRKSYVVSMKAPESVIMDMWRSSELINSMLNSVSEGAKAVRKT